MVKKYRTEKGKGKPIHLVCEERYSHSKKVSGPEKVYKLMKKMGVLKDTEERVHLICLSKGDRIKGVFEVSHGTVSSSLLNDRGIAQRILLADAAGFIIVHNHPSGITRPSFDDLRCSRKMEILAALIGVDYLDFIIVGRDYYSFKRNGMIVSCKNTRIDRSLYSDSIEFESMDADFCKYNQPDCEGVRMKKQDMIDLIAAWEDSWQIDEIITKISDGGLDPIRYKDLQNLFSIIKRHTRFFGDDDASNQKYNDIMYDDTISPAEKFDKLKMDEDHSWRKQDLIEIIEVWDSFAMLNDVIKKYNSTGLDPLSFRSIFYLCTFIKDHSKYVANDQETIRQFQEVLFDKNLSGEEKYEKLVS